MEAHFQQHQWLRLQMNKLQANKSSFQAWKCVSLGYALLALVLLLAKWHEANTDLRLLAGVDQLIWAPSNASIASSSGGGPLESHGAGSNTTTAAAARPSSWPAVPLEMTLLLSAASQMRQRAAGSGASPDGANSSSGALVESLAAVAAGDALGSTLADEAPPDSELAGRNGSSAAAAATLMSRHLQAAAGRELSGGQLLRQEVEAFLAEFRSAKSTLSLSALLVAVYIISWLLMTLAVSDTRISNDVSLRNILLLSVFGAIDMAASFGFVMVRLIMFNVKSNTFVAEILGPAGLRDSHARLGADQLAAFTALRLIAMRSCSAHVDAYVSVLIALLTLLRLYAIIRAIAYYRFLRRFNDSTRNFYHQQQLAAAAAAASTIAASSGDHFEGTSKKRPYGAYENAAYQHRESLGPASKTVWRQQQHASMSPNPQATSQVFVQHVPAHANIHSNGRATHAAMQQFPLMDQPQMVLASPASQTSAYASSRAQPQQSYGQHHSMATSMDSATFCQQQQPNSSKQQQQPSASGLVVETDGDERAPAASSPSVEFPSRRNNSSNQHNPLLLVAAAPASNANTLPQQQQQRANHRSNELPAKRLRQQSGSATLDKYSAPPSVLLVNGRPHRLVAGRRPEARQRRRDANPAEESLLLTPAELSAAGFESEPTAGRQERAGFSSSGRPGLLDANNNNSSASRAERPAAFTLLSAGQLERLSRQLVARATSGDSGLGEARASSTATTLARARAQSPAPPAKYKIIARHRPARQTAERRELAALGEQVGGGRETSERALKRLISGLPASEPQPNSIDSSGCVARVDLSGSGSSSSSGASSPSANLEGSSASASEVEELTAVDSDAGQTLAALHHQQASRRLKSRGAVTSRRRASRPAPNGLRQSEEFSLSPATARNKRALLLQKYYYA